MSTEETQGGQSMLGHGHFTNGQWFCECHRVAICRTIQNGKPYAGQKHWRCQRANNQQCSFFLWVAHEPAAKEWWIASHLPPVPQTPKKGGADSGEAELPRTIETPFTKAKRKLVSVNAPKNENNESRDDRKLNEIQIPIQSKTALDDPFTDSDPISDGARKMAKTSAISTPGQPFVDKLRGTPAILQTPTSKEYKPAGAMPDAPQMVQTPNTSPTPNYKNRIEFNTTEELDPAATVIKILRSDNITLKTSIEAQVRHVISLNMDIEQTKLRRSEQTISSLFERVDELETMVLNLT